MKEEVAKAWVAALRSGKYSQGRTALRKDDGTFCCLGVLCDVVSPENWESSPNHYGDIRHAGSGYFLSRDAMTRAGLTDSSPAAPGYGLLSELNDAESGKSFAEIADIIEKYWEAL